MNEANGRVLRGALQRPSCYGRELERNNSLYFFVSTGIMLLALCELLANVSAVAAVARTRITPAAARILRPLAADLRWSSADEVFIVIILSVTFSGDSNNQIIKPLIREQRKTARPIDQY